MTASERLESYRISTGLSYDAISEQTGISRATLFRIKRGDPTVSQSTLSTLVNALNKLEVERALQDLPGTLRLSHEERKDTYLFTKMMLDACGFSLNLYHGELEIWSNPERPHFMGVKTSFYELSNLKKMTISYYQHLLKTEYPFTFEDEEEQEEALDDDDL